MIGTSGRSDRGHLAGVQRGGVPPPHSPHPVFLPPDIRDNEHSVALLAAHGSSLEPSLQHGTDIPVCFDLLLLYGPLMHDVVR